MNIGHFCRNSGTSELWSVGIAGPALFAGHRAELSPSPPHCRKVHSLSSLCPRLPSFICVFRKKKCLRVFVYGCVLLVFPSALSCHTGIALVYCGDCTAGEVCIVLVHCGDCTAGEVCIVLVHCGDCTVGGVCKGEN